jgi:hypothetical protein
MEWPISPTHLINNIDAHLVTKSDLLKFSIDGLVSGFLARHKEEDAMDRGPGFVRI